MKKFLVTFFIFVTLSVSHAFAYNLKAFSSDATILSAMQLLEQNGEQDIFNNLRRNAVKIKFYNFSMGNVYAANSYDNYGRRLILISSAYRNAPIEQIACLIAHESCHIARKATLEEETIATSKEALCWNKLKKPGVIYPQTKLTKRLNNLAELHVESIQDGNDYIGDRIASSSFYRAQFNL